MDIGEPALQALARFILTMGRLIRRNGHMRRWGNLLLLACMVGGGRLHGAGRGLQPWREDSS
jgi:hypothetical protein